jgi:hypothetical protein
VKGMKKLCVCLLVCACFFTVSAKNAQAGPAANLFSMLFDEEEERKRISLLAQAEEIAGREWTLVKGVYDAFSYLIGQLNQRALLCLDLSVKGAFDKCVKISSSEGEKGCTLINYCLFFNQVPYKELGIPKDRIREVERQGCSGIEVRSDDIIRLL